MMNGSALAALKLLKPLTLLTLSMLVLAFVGDAVGSPPGLALASSGSASETAIPPAQQKLTEAPGVDIVRERCLLCHNEDVVVSQHLARARWDELLDWMVETQGMAEPTTEVRTAILDYLEATQPPRELAVSDSPWAQPRYGPNPIW